MRKIVDGAADFVVAPERVFGTATSIPDCSTGAVSMKMSSSTNTTSINGVMLISAREVCVLPLLEKAISLSPQYCRTRRSSVSSASHCAVGAPLFFSAW